MPEMKHYNIDELVEYIYRDELDIQKTIEINSHIYTCDSCRKKYNYILKVQDIFEDLQLKYLLNENYEKSKDTVTEKNSIKNFIKNEELKNVVEDIKDITQRILVDVMSFTKLEAFANGAFFQHPCLAVTLKSTATLTPTNEEMQNQVIDSKSSKRIVVDKDGSLSVYVPYDKSLIDKKVLLRSESGEDVLYVGEITEYSNLELRVCFEDIIPGKYILVW